MTLSVVIVKYLNYNLKKFTLIISIGYKFLAGKYIVCLFPVRSLQKITYFALIHV